MAKGILETGDYFLFWGGWPSQWTPAQFTVDGVAYNCCEQYMMAEKARVFGDADALAAILAAADPGKQKAIGRRVRDFDDAVWTGVCRGVVYAGNLARFRQDPQARKALLATGGRTIVEASPRDFIWGIGLAKEDPRATDPSQWRGTNWLGVALMHVRDALRRDADSQPADPTDPELIEQLRRREVLRARG